GPRHDPGEASPDMGALRSGAPVVGPGPRHPPAVRPRALRAALPPVLHRHRVARPAHAAHRASEAARDPGRLPLPAAPSLRDGPAPRWEAGRLPGDRGPERSWAPPAPLQRP